MPKQNEQDILNEARSILADLRAALDRPLPDFYFNKVLNIIERLKSNLGILGNGTSAKKNDPAKRANALSRLQSAIYEARRLPPEVLRKPPDDSKIEETQPPTEPLEQQPANGSDPSQNQHSSPSVEKQPIKVFYSFVAEDQRRLKKLDDHLAMLKEQGIITSFNRRKLVAGTNEADAIKKNWEEAAVILLLISPDYLATGYDEMQRALDRSKNNDTIVIPILLRPADIQNSPVGGLIRLPSNGKPVTRWTNRDEAFEDIAQGIREAITQKFQMSPATNSSEKMRPDKLSKVADESVQTDPVVPPVQHQQTGPNSPSPRKAKPSLPEGDSLSTVRDSHRQAGASNTGFPHGYALIIGIARYSDERWRLPEAVVKDVMGMHTILRAADYCGYDSNHVRLRYDMDATADTIRDDLKWLADMTAADKQATAIFYFSGHGERLVIGEEVTHYLIPYNCNPDDLTDAAIADTELIGLLHNIRPPRLLVLLDTCYAGGVDEIKGVGMARDIFKDGFAEADKEFYDRLAQGEGRVVIASSRSTERSRVSSALDNSLFTRYLLEGLRGKAPTHGDGFIRVMDLFTYVEREVLKHYRQSPVITSSGAGNFPVALYQGGKRIDTSDAMDMTTLREEMVHAFSMGELAILCADLTQLLRNNGINDLIRLDLLLEGDLRQKIQGLIEYCERRGYLDYLITVLCKARPNLSICKQR